MSEAPKGLRNPAKREDVWTLHRLAHGKALTRCLITVADFGVADALGDRPETPAALASTIGVNADALGRVLRLLAANGVFEDLNGKFGHSPLSLLLRADHPQSQRDYVRLSRVSWDLFRELDHTMRTGRPGTEVIAKSYFDYIAKRPQDAEVFDAAMTAKARADIAGLVRAYDFSKASSIADIGGGRGHLLTAILEAAPEARGILFDQPHVIEAWRGPKSDRLALVAGDFFKDALPRSDVYILMNVIHDWSDQDSVRILKAVRSSAPPAARLLLIETPLPEKPQDHPMVWLDIYMLALLGGRERKASEYDALLSTSGWRRERCIPTDSIISILEASTVSTRGE